MPVRKNDESSAKPDGAKGNLGVGLGVGVAIGAGIGAALGNVAVGIAVGVAPGRFGLGGEKLSQAVIEWAR